MSAPTIQPGTRFRQDGGFGREMTYGEPSTARAYVYRQSEHDSRDGCDLWTVGYYDPSGEWQPESDHSTAEAAAERVHYLNGGAR